MKQVVQAIRAARCAPGRLVNGSPCDDVQGQLVHISLATMPDSPEKKELLAIPTGLSLQQRDVDLLIATGQTAITSSDTLRRFLDSYPPWIEDSRRRSRASRS